MLSYDEVKGISEQSQQGLLADKTFSHCPITLQTNLLFSVLQNEDLSIIHESTTLADKCLQTEHLLGAVSGYLFLHGAHYTDALTLSQQTIAETLSFISVLASKFSKTFADFLTELNDSNANLSRILQNPKYEVVTQYLELVYGRGAVSSDRNTCQSDLKTDLLTGKNELLSYDVRVKQHYEELLSNEQNHCPLMHLINQYSLPESRTDLPHQHRYFFHQHLGHESHIDGHDDSELHLIGIYPEQVDLLSQGNDLIIKLEDKDEKIICSDVFSSHYVSYCGQKQAHLKLVFDKRVAGPEETVYCIDLQSLYGHAESVSRYNQLLHRFH